MIDVLMDSNESSHDRFKEIKAAVEAHGKLFLWKGFDEIPVDVRFIDHELKRFLSVELKEPADLVGSVLSGHLAKQVLTLQTAQEPGFIVCLGSVSKTYDSVPKVLHGQYRGKKVIEQDFGRVRHFCSASNAAGYPVFFWDRFAPELILSTAYDLINNADVYEFLPKSRDDITEVAMLCLIPTIGPTIAKQLYLKYGSIRKIMDASEEDLAETKINGKRLGKKASEIVKVFK
jgi:hypothetical protein